MDSKTRWIIIKLFRFFILNISKSFNGKNFFENNIYIHLFSWLFSYLISKKNKYKEQHTRILIKFILDIKHSIHL